MATRRKKIESIQLAGDGLEGLDIARLEMLEKMLGGIGLSMIVTYETDRGSITRYPEHIPEDADFLAFDRLCREQGFSNMQSHNGWRAMVTTQGEHDNINR